MRNWLALASILGVLGSALGCGGSAGAPSRHPDDVVTATWTDDDDAPLDAGTTAQKR